MRYFKIAAEHPTPNTGPLAWVDGRHRWMLPNRIGCPDCTVYGALGPAYPSIDLSDWPEAATLTEPTRASWRQFCELSERLAPVVGPRVLLLPGAEFGPFQGTVDGGPADFVLGPIHFLFATPAATARLAESGVRLPSLVPALVRGNSRAPKEFVEFDVPSDGRLAAEGFTLRAPAPCATCGRWDRVLDRVLLEEGSVERDTDLLRPLNHATIVLASERFVTAVDQAELTGLAFEPVDIAVADT